MGNEEEVNLSTALQKNGGGGGWVCNFILFCKYLYFSDPEICLSYVGMLVEHFNSHVRYGAVMALGIACAGSGYKV